MILRVIFFRELTCQKRYFVRRLFLGCVKFVGEGYSSLSLFALVSGPVQKSIICQFLTKQCNEVNLHQSSPG